MCIDKLPVTEGSKSTFLVCRLIFHKKKWQRALRAYVVTCQRQI